MTVTATTPEELAAPFPNLPRLRETYPELDIRVGHSQNSLWIRPTEALVAAPGDDVDFSIALNARPSVYLPSRAPWLLAYATMTLHAIFLRPPPPVRLPESAWEDVALDLHAQIRQTFPASWRTTSAINGPRDFRWLEIRLDYTPASQDPMNLTALWLRLPLKYLHPDFAGALGVLLAILKNATLPTTTP